MLSVRWSSVQNRASSASSGQSRASKRWRDCVSVVARNTDVTVLGGKRPAMRRQHPRIAEPLFGFGEDAVPEMVDEVEGDHRLEHRNMDFLPFAGALAVKQRHADRRGENIAADLVAYRHRHIAGFATDAAVERGKTALPLDHVVEGRAVAMHRLLAEAGGGGVDEARVAGRERIVVDAEPFRRAQPHVVDE